jgi:excinuclease UvrABC ATPase subunit
MGADGVVAQGAPEEVANKKSSYTGRYLRDVLDG